MPQCDESVILMDNNIQDSMELNSGTTNSNMFALSLQAKHNLLQAGVDAVVDCLTFLIEQQIKKISFQLNKI